MSLHESGQMYLETIYVLSQKTGAVRSLDVAEYMGYSKPSVSRAVSLLKKENYIVMDSDGHLNLTETGKAVAETIFDRHTTLTKMFTSLGVDPETASEDACRIEHVISDESFNAIKAHLKQHT